MSPVPRGRKSRFPVRCAVAFALLAMGLVAAGCGDTLIDGTKTEDTLKASLENSLHEKITSVECPSDQKVKPGKTFTCTVDFADGKHATATLKIRDKEANISVVGLKQNK